MITFQKVDHTRRRLLRDIAESTFRDTYSHLNDPDQFEVYCSDHFSQERIDRELEEASSTFFFLIQVEQTIGYTKLNFGNAQTETMPEDHLEIERFYLCSGHHGKGYGRSMMEFIKDYARSQSYRTLWLGVWEKNPKALAFYARMGMTRHGSHTFVIGDDRQTDYIMKMDI